MKQRNWYTVLLLCSFILAGMIYVAGIFMPNTMKIAKAAFQYAFQPSEGSFSVGNFWTDGAEEALSEVGENAFGEQKPTDGAAADLENSDSGETNPAQFDQTIPQEGTVVKIPQIPDDFSGVLFIGDSRTVGLSEYGKLGNAEVFADTGMSVYNVTKKALPGSDGEKHALDERLQENSYTAILVMLGINELGYDRTVSCRRYGELVAHIRELQPDAWIVLEANLHVTEEQSEKDEIFNNTNINEVNANILQIAREQKLGYLDVNVLFDDENGCLRSDYSADGAHVLGSYYDDWSDWILGQLQSGAAGQLEDQAGSPS